MSVVQIKQIVKKIEETYNYLLDFSDIKDFDLSKEDHKNMAVSRGMNAFVLEYLTGCTSEDAALSVTDSSKDNGLDAIFYDSNANCLYVCQAKYDHVGKSEPDLGAVKKFIDGFKDLLELRFEKFNDKIKKRQAEIESVLEKTGLKAKLLLIYTGVNKSKTNKVEFEQLMDEYNDFDSDEPWLSYEYFTQKELYEILTSANTPSIDTDIIIHNFGLVETNVPKACYGQIAASDLGELWKKYGTKLFSANIRNLLLKSDINDDMVTTLKTASRLFWYFNNGITMICDRFDKKRIGGASTKIGYFDVKNISIVNGAQTTGTIGTYYLSLPEEKAEQALADTFVQVRIIQTKDNEGNEVEPDLGKLITINNNMQNKIIARDFASQTDLQKRLKTELELEGITYHISRGDTEISNATNFTISEAGRARCNTIGIKYLMLAHRSMNTHLFKNMESNEYNAVFNPILSGIEIWNTVLIQRAIDEILLKERKNHSDIREIIVYGKDYLSYLAFNKFWAKINKTEIVEIKESDKKAARAYIIQMAENILSYIPSFDKPTRNIFQSENDVESIHESIKASL